ncbi:hypothetical protein Ddye_004305 [Dipteronia dyeriana]|uniref:PPIase cyclophilin-type domain-containing protein n=1 Tax=Dipteronia dyeriana TaxID=168575 RepID=A0AAD9XTX1_9ROSI|nr:hypothetical protein Ddye_004305 [Dipteronia dyeriana]
MWEEYSEYDPLSFLPDDDTLDYVSGKKVTSTVGKPLHYKGSTFHCVVPGYVVHGGDITHRNGTGGESIYGPNFVDDNFLKKHIDPGILSTTKTST